MSRGNRSTQYNSSARAVPPEKLEQLEGIKKKHDMSAQVELIRAELAERLEAEKSTPPEATDENALDFARSMASTYIAFFGRKPLDYEEEIEDLIYQLQTVKAELGTDKERKHAMINELRKNGAHWADIHSPSNVGAYVFPDWEQMCDSARRQRLDSLHMTNNTWNSRHNIRRRADKSNKP